MIDRELDSLWKKNFFTHYIPPGGRKERLL
jgi:hypothetical protein